MITIDEPTTAELIELAHASLAAYLIDGAEHTDTEQTSPEQTSVEQVVTDLVESALTGMTGGQFLTALRTGADAYLADQRPVNTTDAYKGDWKVWEAFCAAKGVPLDVANADLLMAFVIWMEHTHGYAPVTMTRRVAGTVRTLRDRLGEMLVPKGISARASEAIKGYDRRLRKANIELGRGEAALITPDMLIAMVATQPTDTLLGLRNRALLLMWYHLGGRRAELAELLITDITDDGHVLIVHMRDSKTGEREAVVARKPGSALDPVTAWYTWLTAAGITEGPAFPRMHRSGKPLGPITPKSVGTVITESGRAAGITIHLTGHGMRAGHITTVLEKGASIRKVALQTGHDPAGRSIYRYWRVVQRRTDNTSVLIDLD